MSDDETYVVAARWIFPICGPPIQRGWIRMGGDRVVELGTGTAPSGAIDLGDAAVLPGLVNAHTHLEFSDVTAPIGQPGIALNDWIGQVIASRQSSDSDSKAAAIAAGIAESRQCGVQLIGEITTTPCDYPATDVRLVTFAETLGLSAGRGDERLTAAANHVNNSLQAAISPHAPYSTSRALIESCVEIARADGRPLAMHVAESPDERELLTTGCGPFHDTLRRLGVWQDDLFPWPGKAMDWLIERLASAPSALLIHCNDLRDHELDKMATFSNTTAVYCPRTHAFFKHASHPVQRMIDRSIRVALGTDSRASNPDLNLWREAQFLLNHRQDIRPSDVLKMATLAGAEALMSAKHGRIAAGTAPGLGVIETSATTVEQVFRDCADRDYQPVFKPTCNPSDA